MSRSRDSGIAGCCGAGTHMLTRPHDLQAMATAEFWEQGDVGLMKAWVSDLRTVGYKFPEVRARPQPPALLPVNPDLPTPQHWCGI